MFDKPLKLDSLDGYQFEELIAKIMKKKGYSNIRVQPYSGDVGKDILMDDSSGLLILVECKHQKFVGRPVVQKLQGAMNHEEGKHNRDVKGMIVTSGVFSDEAIQYNKEINQDIEFIDGKKLKSLCNELNIVILNGKVQIITNLIYRNFDSKKSETFSHINYSKIYGSKAFSPKISVEDSYRPTCFVHYTVNFETFTSIGRIDSYSDSGNIIIDGVTGHPIEEDISHFYISGRHDLEEVKEEHALVPYEFTENDVEDQVINSVIKEHTHTINYTGNNNVTYTKQCIPKKRDIDILNFESAYLPIWTNTLIVNKIPYLQKFYSKGSDALYLKDELKICKICSNKEEEYADASICPECAKIVCKQHVKIDYYDKETPICTNDAKPLKIFIQNKYFATMDNLNSYQAWLETRNLFEKIYEDKIALGLSIAGLFFMVYFVIRFMHFV